MCTCQQAEVAWSAVCVADSGSGAQHPVVVCLRLQGVIKHLRLRELNILSSIQQMGLRPAFNVNRLEPQSSACMGVLWV